MTSSDNGLQDIPFSPLSEAELAAELDKELDTETDDLKTLKYHLLGPSLTKAGQEKVDQSKVSEIIYNASKGSKYFNREELRDKVLTQKIQQIIAKKTALEKLDLTRDLRNADRLITEFELTRDLSQYIVHVDCDAFYATVELLSRPDLKDKPFAVGGGVLTTCNYVAREFGCRSGMAGFVAKKLCPQLIMLKADFAKYTAKAREIREILADYDPRFESASIDEAYLNMTEYCTEHDLEPPDAVEKMRKEVAQKTGVTISAGIAANGKLAKICSNMNKPNGQFVLANDRNVIMAFMRDLPTRKVNGIGRVLERELLEIGVKVCGDLYAQRQYLLQLFGEKTFEFLMRIYLGLGRTRIQPAEDYERKSVGTESTFREMSEPQALRDKLRWTARELEKDMKKAECKGRTICLKVKLHTFEVYTRQVVVPKAIHLEEDLYNFSLPMLAKLEKEIPAMKLRLMGLRCTQLVSTKRPDTMAFFGFKRRSDMHDGSETGPVKRKARDYEEPLNDMEKEELDGAFLEDPPLAVNDDNELALLNDETLEDEYRHHGKEITPNPKKHQPQSIEEEEWWDCPICARPQPTDERTFNEHIDLCLSRQTIRDAVQQDADGPTNTAGPAPLSAPGSTVPLPEGKKQPKGGGDRKRAKKPEKDGRQTKLTFG